MKHQINPNMPGRWLTCQRAHATTGRKLKGAALGLLLALSGPLGTTVLGQATVNDLLHGYPGGVVAPATFSPVTHTGTGYSIDLGTTGNGLIFVTNASFLNIGSSNQMLSMSMWVKEYGIADSSAFWGVSPSSGGGRGWNVHFPWGDNDNIYFDTAGCCDGNAQRINETITDFPPYVTVGDDSFWTNWHHLVALYNNTDKQIWIDGQLFLDGTSTNPLPTDFTNLFIGASSPSGSSMHALIDDYAAFSTALSSNSIQLLYSGTSPTNLPGEKALAYWSFDNPPEIGPLVGAYNGFTYTLYNTSTRVTDPSTIALTLNGQAVTQTSLTTNGAILTLTYAVPNPPLVPGSTNAVSLTLKDTKANSYSSAGSFVVQQFTVVPTNQMLAAGAATTRGFYLQTYAVDAASAGGTAAQSDSMLAGGYGPNYAATTDPVAGNVGANGFFTWTTVINFDIAGYLDPVGDFQSPNYNKYAFPGIPSILPGTSTNVDTANFVCQFYTALEFPSSGLYTMGVDSDDGFRVTLGLNPPSLFGPTNAILGEFDSVRGWADTDFQFYIQQPGLYPFRLLYWQVGGGANLEWFMINPNGIKVLIDDTTNSIAAYEWLPTSSTAYLEGVSPAPDSGGVDTNLVVSAVIIDGTSSVVATSTVKLQIDGKAVNATVSKTNGQTTVTYAASSPVAAGSGHSATLSYTAGTIPTTFSWTFFIEGLVSLDVVNKNIAQVSGTALFTPNGGGHTGKPGDYGIDQGALSTGWVTITNCSFLDLAVSNQVLAMSMWLKKYDIDNGSAFWADFGGTVGSRAWNVHFPWNNDNVYFDTDGCCDGNAQRINADINTFPPYQAVGSDTWWNSWHHLVAQYNKTDKQIWIDGQMFLEGTSTNPLPVEFDYLWLCRDSGGDVEHAVIDDFSVYSTALDATDIMALYNGTAPNAISAKASLLAWWPFDDPPTTTTGAAPTIGIALASGKLVITYTGTLLSSATVSGPYSAVTGATSPYTVPTPGGPHIFYRAQQ